MEKILTCLGKKVVVKYLLYAKNIKVSKINKCCLSNQIKNQLKR